jgi:Flp pilus assembly protein TadG
MLNRLVHDHRGSAAVEFALILPVVILLYYGMAETTQALLANRRVSVVATAVGDLTAQATQLKKAQIDDIFNISAAALKPFPVTPLGIRIVSIETNASSTPQIRWQQQRGTFPSGVDLKTVEKAPNIAIIRAETIYTYQTPFGRIFPKAFTFKKQMDMRPRGGVAVTLLD